VLDLEGDRPLPALDLRLDPAANARAEQARRGGGQSHLAAVVELDPHAVDRQLRLAVPRRTDGVGGTDSIAGGGGRPGTGPAPLLSPSPAPPDGAPASGAAASARGAGGGGLGGEWLRSHLQACRTRTSPTTKTRRSMPTDIRAAGAPGQRLRGGDLAARCKAVAAVGGRDHASARARARRPAAARRRRAAGAAANAL